MLRFFYFRLFFFITFSLKAQAPSAYFTVSQQAIFVGVPLNFINQSTYGGLTASQKKWDFGDGTSINSAPTHRHILPGTYQVSLTVTTKGVTNTKIKQDYIVVAPILNAAFTTNDTLGCLNRSITCTYTDSGLFNITLKAKNAAGCIKSLAYNNITVLARPIAGISLSDSIGCVNTQYTYSNSSTQSSGIPLSSYLWTFPNGTIQTINLLTTTTNYTFSSEGNYTLTLKANDAFGCSSLPKSKSISIARPRAIFMVDSVVCDEEIFTAVNNSTGDGILSYNWKIDNLFNSIDTNFSSSFNEIPSNSYTFVPHTLTLITSDIHTCKDSISKTIKVSMPKAKINYLASGSTPNVLGEYICPPVLETFNDNSISYGSISTWNWIFGNFLTSTLQNPVNSYIFPGIYTTSLAIRDQFGCTSDTTITNYLKILGPKADFNVTAIGNVCDHTYEFLATNLVTVASSVWNLGDGAIINNSTLFNHSYSNSIYAPSIKLIDQNNCEVLYPLAAIDLQVSAISVDAGPDQVLCNNATSMSATSSLLGDKFWKLISGSGTITDSISPTTTITNLGEGLNIFLWTAQLGCDYVVDTLKISNGQITSQVGISQTLFSSTTNFTANEPFLGTGYWSAFSGAGILSNTLNPTISVSNLSNGMNKFIWTITNQCVVTSDTLFILVEVNPTIPAAGVNDVICGTESQLIVNEVVVGVGVWSLISGAGTISNPLLETSFVTGLGLGESIFQWKISNTCRADSSRMILTRMLQPTIPKTETSPSICSKTAVIKGNKALVGTGIWSLKSGIGTILNTLDSTTTVSNLSVGLTILRWIISNACDTNYADVQIVVDTTPTKPKVGKDQFLCESETILSGNKPFSGKGHWSIISGYGLLHDSTEYTSGISDLIQGTTILKWTIENSCDSRSEPYKIESSGKCPNEDSLAKLLVYFIPNTFTPNGDKKKPYFLPVFTSGIDPYSYSFLVFDRWGNVLFESHDARVGWDGMYGSGIEIVT